MTDEAPPKISHITRQSIVDALLLRERPFHGGLDLLEFLNRVWDLNDMPSQDPRFRSAAGDINTHMSFGDWTESYLLMQRLSLRNAPDAQFFKFLEQCVHPLVLSDDSEASEVATLVNAYLRQDGFGLEVSEHISGRAIRKVRSVSDVERHSPVRGTPTGWLLVDRQVAAVKDALSDARATDVEELYQVVGQLCRQALISLAQAVYDPEHHPPPDGTVPGKTDAKRMLDAYVNATLPGGGNEALRKAVKSIVDATSAVVHDRSATLIDAALCAELTIASVNIVHIISGGLEA